MHQIFPVTIKFIYPTPQERPTFNIQNESNLALRYIDTPLQNDDLYYYKTFYFKVLDDSARLPDITIQSSGFTYTLQGKTLHIEKLNYPHDFCNVLAKQFRIETGKSVQFNKDLNLIVLKLASTMGNLEDFTIPAAQKGEIKEFNESFPHAEAIYYAFVPADITQLKLSYFDTQKREFKKLLFNIQVKDEIVSTQSDLNPSQDKNRTLKIAIAFGAGIFLLLLAIWLRSIFIALLGVALIVYGGYLLIPLQKVCVKAKSKIYILPTKNSTIFRINENQKRYIKLNEVNGYTKIELDKKLVGWVKNEDLCKN